jgi:hypothetical protein
MIKAGPAAVGGLPAAVLAATPRLVEKSIPDVSVLTTTASPVTLFTVTGVVIAKVVGVSGAALASTSSTGTLAVGVSGATAVHLAAATINGTNFPAANTVWTGDASPTVLAEVMSAGPLTGVLQGPTPIIATIATNNLTTGSIKFYCIYTPVSSDGAVVAA